MNASQSTAPSESKRDFLKILFGGSLVAWVGAILYPVIAYLRPPKQPEVEVTSVTVGPLESLKKGSGTIVRFGNKPVLVVRMDSGEVRAFSATCTHLDCTVQYRHDMGVIWCACHNGKYDLSGKNIAGPPPRPLDPYRVIIQGEEVLVARNA
jgi:cytochrome b6-f complex iron-sulfur subunit